MPWVKGQSGNPGGGKKNSWKARLQRAIIKEGENIGETPFEHAAKLFYTNRDACIGMLNFFIPKLRTVDAKLVGESPFKLFISLPEPKVKQIDSQVIPVLTTDKQPVNAEESNKNMSNSLPNLTQSQGNTHL